MKHEIKSRAFKILLYPVTESYDTYQVMKHIVKNYDYVSIYHDKDVKEDGTPDDPHFHYVIRWTGAPRYASGLAKEFGIDSRFFIPIYGGDDTTTGLKYSLTYLVHKDLLDKYQYNTRLVRHKPNSKLFTLFRRYVFTDVQLSEGEILLELVEFVRKNRYVSTADMIIYTVQNGWHQVYKKYTSQVHRLMDEHNTHYNYDNYD